MEIGDLSTQFKQKLAFFTHTVSMTYARSNVLFAFKSTFIMYTHYTYMYFSHLTTSVNVCLYIPVYITN